MFVSNKIVMSVLYFYAVDNDEMSECS